MANGPSIISFLAKESGVEKMALKLHRQFGHPSQEKLMNLIKSAGITDGHLKQEIAKVTEDCDTCKRYKKPASRPVVSIPLATKFNKTVSMDLKKWNDIYFLVLVDVGTRYTQAAVVKDKLPQTILKAIFKCWIALFGAPSEFFSDNGGEFNNSQMRELCDLYNVKFMCTAAESPFSNGICERSNAIIGNSVRKIMEDCACDVEVALAWAVAARNSLLNNHGFSPNQLVFGFNPAFPNVYQSDLPALESPSASQVVADNLNAMHRAREEFIKMESNERIKRALRHNVRQATVESISNGDNIFYKRNNDPRWRGPAIVIGVDGKQAIVKHGGMCIRVHTFRLQRHENIQSPEEVNERPIEDENVHEVEDGLNVPPFDITLGENCEGALSLEYKEPELPIKADMENGEKCENKYAQLKIGMRFEGIHSSSGEYFTGRIISRAGKATGKFKNRYNVKCDADGSIGSIDFESDFQEWKSLPDNEEVLVCTNTEAISEAKEKEFHAWMKNDVFAEVEDEGQRSLSVRWIITEKERDGAQIVKARLVVRGFEEDAINIQKDSPTCTKESIRIALSVMSCFGWSCHSIDITAAFLQGGPIDRDIYLRPPNEFYVGKLWKLKKTVYGLNDAARAWFTRVHYELLHLNMKASRLDPALFFWYDQSELAGIICLHVDDFFWSGTEKFEKEIIDKLRLIFQIGSAEDGSFKYVGLNIDSAGNGFTVDQLKYASTLNPVVISQRRIKAKTSALMEGERRDYRSAVGQLNWISTQTRPDISFDVCELSQLFNRASVGDMVRVNKVIQRVKTDAVKLVYPRLSSLSECYFECYSDASFGNLSDSGSQGGYIIFISDGTGVRCPISWQSRKLKRVVKSTLAAETLALLDCAEAAVYLSSILAELTLRDRFNIRCYVDNKSLVESLNSCKLVDDKRLRIDMAVLKNMISCGEIEPVSWISTEHQLANCLTKRGASVGSLLAAVRGQ